GDRSLGLGGTLERDRSGRERQLDSTFYGCRARSRGGRVVVTDRDPGRGASRGRERKLPGRSGGTVTLEPVPGRGNPPLCRLAQTARYASWDHAIQSKPRAMNAIPLLKSAPEAEQLAERLDGGDWRGIEIALMPQHIADDDALARAAEATREATEGLVVTAEAPVAWPSGAFVRVDRLDDEARAGIDRSAEFAARVGSPVLTIHLFIPLSPDEFRASGAVDADAVEKFLGFYAEACLSRGIAPLIENVPPVLRMRTGGVFLSPIGGHWRDLVDWRERVPELGFTIDTSHAALFRSFATVYPGLFAHPWDEELELGRYVEELGPHA